MNMELKILRTKVHGLFSYLITVTIAVLACVGAAPLLIPDLTKCEIASASAPAGPPVTLYFNCCLPIPDGPMVDFSFEKYKPTTKHIRRAAHTASEQYIAKINKAYELMKALPETDGRSFQAQANLHCSFCNGGYPQRGVSGNIPVQVHFSWLFLPWHRWYLYFHERILGSLIGDPSFSLVFWNWDDQINGGNRVPEMFTRVSTSIYDSNRNPNVQPSTVIPLAATTAANDSETIVTNKNLNNMYQSMVTASTATLFMGGAYRAGDDLTNATVLNAPFGGAIENGVHNGIHFYTGDPRTQLLQDMGNFATASRDPIFYAHHSNIDRLWEVWRYDMPDGERFVHTDPDFLNAEFVFYDETGQMVRVTAKDALDSKKLGVYYKKVRSDDLWINYNPPPITNVSAVPAAIASGVPYVGESPLNGTINIGTNFSAIVKRPAEKKPSHKLEVLNIQGVQALRDEFFAIIAFVNIPGAGPTTGTASAEYLGTFNVIPASGKNRHLMANIKYEIGDNLKRIGIEKEEELVISLVVAGSNTTVTIEGLKIDYEDK
ncbi:hypothetical protein KP509_01G032700 [Ceratopteris richardii]|uniref:Tyrosinase copper-binding domain-containing protein n=1 Tax=Ceratopteris richardii TaxID=49495 RepID=A0A8T2VFM8_CERRI|nr:hypothetical protein KP509_01G032700 [Ceratopteris richardii]